MKLIPFSPEYLRLDATLPFGVRDATGRLLLHAGARIEGELRLNVLRAQALFADEAESQQWHRRLGAAMGVKLRENAPLKEIAAARPADELRRAEAAADVAPPDAWAALATQLDAALRDAPGADDWVARVRAARSRALPLARKHTDASLYHLIQMAALPQLRYSAHHALLVMLVADQAAQLLGWGESERDSLAGAALSMNVAMTALQDLLAQTEQRPTAVQRSVIDTHAAQGADWLHAAGLGDPLWCDAVRRHHDGDATGAAAEASGVRLGGLLRRVDVFTAKISARRRRAALSPLQAAREACLDRTGKPDEIGGALLRATGLYPPGSCVELANGERGIVVARGRRANLPWVASLVGASGLALGEPALRDTLDARFAVRAAVPADSLKVRPDPQRLMALHRPSS